MFYKQQTSYDRHFLLRQRAALKKLIMQVIREDKEKPEKRKTRFTRVYMPSTEAEIDRDQSAIIKQDPIINLKVNRESRSQPFFQDFMTPRNMRINNLLSFRQTAERSKEIEENSEVKELQKMATFCDKSIQRMSDSLMRKGCFN